MPKELSTEQDLPLALLMDRNGYQLDPQKPLGRQSAGASFLEAYLRFSRNKLHSIAVANHNEATWFHQQAKKLHPQSTTRAVKVQNWGDAGKASGAFHVPDPRLDNWAWKRMPWGDGAFSLIGLVHTLCSYNVQHSLGQISSSPLRNWDALICTSKAAKQAVTGFLERQEEWIHQRHRGSQFERPLLPVIPLGIHSENWQRADENNIETSKRARKDLGISPIAEVVLVAGRLDILTKMQPAPLLRALGELKQDTHPNLELLVYGEAPNPDMHDLWVKGIKQLVPELPIHWIPGRKVQLASKVRWAADIFVSLSDNPQETFGITPLEAMAAGLPCIVSDWDGYRDTVIQPGESEPATGFRIPTRLVEGLGKEQAHYLLQDAISFDLAVGQISQGIAVDLAIFKKATSTLLSNPELRASMSAAGQKRVQQNYSWHVVIEQWRSLVLELQKRRLHARLSGQTIPPQLPPWLQDTSISFGCFASQVLPAGWAPKTPDPEVEASCLDNPFQSWDVSLLKNDSARRRGWWLKNGLVEP